MGGKTKIHDKAYMFPAEKAHAAGLITKQK
jgi:hypothetical protein